MNEKIVLERLKAYYEEACLLRFVKKPWSWALYQTLKDVDAMENPPYAYGWNSAIEIIGNAPTVDAVPVVRCKDCRKRYTPECALHQGETCDEYGNIERHFCGSMARDDFYCGLGAKETV